MNSTVLPLFPSICSLRYDYACQCRIWVRSACKRDTHNRGHLPIFHCLHAVALRDSVVHDNVFILDNFWQLFKQILNIQEIGSYDEPVKRPIARCVPIFIAVNKTATVVSRSSPIVEADGLPQCDEELLARIIV